MKLYIKFCGFGTVQIIGGKDTWYFDGVIGTKTLMAIQRRMRGK